MNLVFCGPPFSGKSTVSRLAAEKLGWELLDTDRLIEKKVGCTCRDFYLEQGEEVFREVERGILESLRKVEQKVIALGGGVTNVELVKHLGRVFYLKLPIEELWKRMNESSQKPAYLIETDPFQEFSKRVAPRLAYYEKMADHILDGKSSSEEIAQQAALFHKSPPRHRGIER